MINISQIRAARALLDWSQSDLAEKASLSQTGIARIENGTNKPNSRTIDKIIKAFDSAGIEFIDDSGVKKRVREVVTLTGREGFEKFRHDVLYEVRSDVANVNVCITNLDERLFDYWGEGKINESYRNSMAEIRKKHPELKFRSIVKEGDMHFSAHRHSEYKWIRSKDFGYLPFYIYGNKTAMIMFSEDDINIFVIDHPMITRYYREQFEKLWAEGEDPQ